ncbi:MAG: M48 family metallopeptidase [Gammaproteobacteria bacterium]|nr:M48 family metallopeptidase [Gammaproteobacteria bacterium]
MQCQAHFYNGQSSTQVSVNLFLNADDSLSVMRDDQRQTFALNEFELQAPIGQSSAKLFFNTGASCEFKDPEFFAHLDQLKHPGFNFTRLLRRMEKSWPYVVLALVVTVISVWVGVNYGLPSVAKSIAFSIPANTEQLLSDKTLATLDRLFFSESNIDENQKQKIRDGFLQIINHQETPDKYHLEFRYSEKMGANAFALPSGTIVITDDLIKLAEHENEIIAVLAHEVGHVHNRHALRQILQDSFVFVLLTVITGDVMSNASFASALPIFLTQAKFSRSFEHEADEFAKHYLQSQGLSPQYLADMLSRLDKHAGSDDKETSFLSTHPATPDRIKRLVQ